MTTVPVVLLQPPGTCRAFTRSGSCYPPLGLCQLAAVAEPGFVEVVDADGMGWSDEDAIRGVLDLGPRLVGMTVTSFTTDLVERFARRFVSAGVEVILGGPHASLAPHDLFERCPSASYLVRGEGEVIFAELCRRAARGAPLEPLPGLWSRRQGPLPPADVEILRVEQFERHPFPSLAGLPIASYWCPDAKSRPLVTMMTARGCPHRCAFCSSPTLLGRSVRAWAPERIVTELLRLRDDHGIREVSFVDDVFTYPRSRALELCRAMREQAVGMSWFCNARADQITEELASAMAEAGCHQVYLGFESGSNGMLRSIDKGTTVEKLERGAAMLKAAGIDRSIGFVVGLPGESDDTVAATARLAERIRPERVQFTAFTALPGSPLGASYGSGGTFHGPSDGRVRAWIEQLYAACGGSEWGRESW